MTERDKSRYTEGSVNIWRSVDPYKAAFAKLIARGKQCVENKRAPRTPSLKGNTKVDVKNPYLSYCAISPPPSTPALQSRCRIRFEFECNLDFDSGAVLVQSAIRAVRCVQLVTAQMYLDLDVVRHRRHPRRRASASAASDSTPLGPYARASRNDNDSTVPLSRLRTAFGDEAPCKTTTYNRFGEFKRGRVSLGDEFREGRPSAAVNNKNIDAVRRMIESDKRVTYTMRFGHL
ncbi:hypothetical protein EVAR_80676_1 [Eumeta japonica]|uniref:Uncharacterized protein n=1 Tax=Eumeta variegata TaxID=151549 RepID=A0A4C1U3M5_EUMVA|nr:hypothetical protein EVAR_80676_1 [Eumeta japonica]